MFELTSVRRALDEPHDSFELNESFAIEDFSVEGLEYNVQGPAVLEALISYVGDGVLVLGKAVVPVSVACVRCLEDMNLELEADINVVFYLEEMYDEEGEALPSIDEQGDIALFEEAYAALRIEAPFAPVCSPTCKGLCPKCGTNLNEETCSCSSEVDPSHPFAGLKDLISTEE